MSEQQTPVSTQEQVEQPAIDSGTQQVTEQAGQETAVDTAALLGFEPMQEPEQADVSTSQESQPVNEAVDSTQEESKVETQQEDKQQEDLQKSDEPAAQQEAQKPEETVMVMIDGEWKEMPKSSLKIKLGDEELPADELEKGYMRQKAWTQKTQKLKEVLKEVSALKADLSASNAIKLDKETIEKIYSEAVNEAKNIVGEDSFDEYDPKVQAVITERFNALASETKRNIYVTQLRQQHVEKLQQQDGIHFHRIDNLAEEILNTEYPATVKESVLKAAAVGNMQPLLEIYNVARQRYYQVQQAEAKTNLGVGGNPLAAALGVGVPAPSTSQQLVNQQKPPAQPKPEPPVTEAASFGNDVKTPPRTKEPDILELLGMT